MQRQRDCAKQHLANRVMSILLTALQCVYTCLVFRVMHLNNRWGVSLQSACPCRTPPQWDQILSLFWTPQKAAVRLMPFRWQHQTRECRALPQPARKCTRMMVSPLQGLPARQHARGLCRLSPLRGWSGRLRGRSPLAACCLALQRAALQVGLPATRSIRCSSLSVALPWSSIPADMHFNLSDPSTTKGSNFMPKSYVQMK